MALMNLSKSNTLSDRAAAEIRARLGRLGQSQAALAAALGVAPMWVSDRLSGKTQIGLNDLDRFADALGVTPAELLPASTHRVTSPYLPDRSTRRPTGGPQSVRPAGRRHPSGPGRTAPVRARLAPAS